VSEPGAVATGSEKYVAAPRDSSGRSAKHTETTMGNPSKLGSLVDADFVPHRYANSWDVQKTRGPERLVIGPESNQVELMLDLAQALAEPFGILYLLLISRRGREPARYQSPYPCERAEVESFFRSFKEFFEFDGRHHVWLISLPDSSTIVYDQHNVIYAYGPRQQFQDVLRKQGFRRGSVIFPAPHSHHYNSEFDDEEERLLAYWHWQQSPLQESDNL